ncbi:MAG TPA: TonB-dependent receptor [Gemmatimonadaceae bacterium]|nr:TonB-dependent receptor [Gemmatimonadaceae bacterium]
MSTSFRTLVIATIGATALGAQQPTADSTRTPRLPKVITTASRYGAPADSLPRRVEVISRVQLDATPALDMVDLLKKRASLDVVQYPGLLGGIGIRGFRPQVGSLQQRALILLDGRPSGITNVSMLDLQDVERIEVLKGPGSSLYGSSAMGGVVNVVTRRRSGKLAGQFSAAGGSFGSTEFRAQGGGTVFAGIDADISVRRYDQRDDYDIGDGNSLRGVFGRDSALKIYPTGARPNRYVADTLGDGLTRVFTSMATTSGNLRVGGTVAGRLRVDVRGDVFDAQDLPSPGDLYSAATPFPGNSFKNLRRTGGALEFGGTVRRNVLTARLFTTDEASDYFNRPDSTRFVNFVTQAVTRGVQLQDVLQVLGQQLVVGVDYTGQQAKSRRYAAAGTEAGTFSPDNEVRSLAAFTEARITALDGRLVATAGARADRVTLALLTTPLRPDVIAGEDDFTVFNPSAGLLYTLPQGVRAHGSIGRAFLAPDAFGRAGLTQTVAANVAAITFGNPGLEAEHSVTADIGLGISRLNGAFDADVTYFTTDVTNRITTARASFAAGSRPTLANGNQVSRVTTSVNAGDAEIRGLEAAVRYDIDAVLKRSWSLNAFANVTRIFSATESTPTVTVDAAQFNGQSNFSPSSIFQGVRIGAPLTELRIKNVASANWNLGLEYDDRSRFRLGALGRYVGTRTDNDFSDFSDISDIEYPPFAVLDLTGGVRITRRLRADVQVSNVTDENYYEKRGYNLPGRAFTLRLTTAF